MVYSVHSLPPTQITPVGMGGDTGDAGLVESDRQGKGVSGVSRGEVYMD